MLDDLTIAQLEFYSEFQREQHLGGRNGSLKMCTLGLKGIHNASGVKTPVIPRTLDAGAKAYAVQVIRLTF